MTTNRFTRWYWPGLMLWTGLLVLISYGSAVNLPFMADDFFHLPFVDTHSFGQIWLTAEGLYYYRPVTFALWKIFALLLGHHDPVVLHAFNLVLHWLNSWLVAWLAGQFWLTGARIDWRRRYLSATLFVLFPLSYQSVPWPGALVHVLVTACILVSVAAYLQARITGRRRWLVLSWGVALVAPFVHENGVLVGPLLVALELLRRDERMPGWRRIVRTLGWFVPVILWWLVSHAVPITHSSTESLAFRTPYTILRNLIYFAQGAAYPLTWLGRSASDWTGSNDFGTAATLAGVALLIAALVQWRGGADRRSAFGWLWFGLTALPAIVFLGYSYVSISPRMLTLPSVGLAWLWAEVVLIAFDRLSKLRLASQLGRAVVVGLAVAVLVQNLAFIIERMNLYRLGGQSIAQTADQLRQADAAGRRAVFVNLPGWIAPTRSTYALGTEGVLLLPSYAPLKGVPQVYLGHAASISAVRIESIQADTPYYVGLREAPADLNTIQTEGSQVFVTSYTAEALAVEPVGVLSDTLPPGAGLAEFDQAVTLAEANATRTTTGLRIELVWHVQGTVAEDVTAFVHVLDANGQLIAQADGDPLAGTYPFWQWPVGVVTRDIRLVNIPAATTVRVGLYSRSSGERLMAVSLNNVPVPDNAAAIEVH